MEKWYLYFNLFLLIVIIILIYRVLYPSELTDIKKIDRQYQKIKNNEECLNYLQTLNNVPLWRYAILFGTIITAIEIIFYILGGGPINKQKHFLMFWVLYMLNVFFLYKVIANRNWHYMCSDGCLKDW